MATKRASNRGFSLIELLIVVAILGIIASILIPNLLDALQKAKQKRTMSEIRSAGIAWMAWLTDQHGAASAGGSVWSPPADMTEQTLAQMTAYLAPTSSFFYIAEVPAYDGWENPIRYGMSSSVSYRVMLIGSPGRDGTFSPDFLASRNVAAFITTDYNQDIVWADGIFVTWPDNVQN